MQVVVFSAEKPSLELEDIAATFDVELREYDFDEMSGRVCIIIERHAQNFCTCLLHLREDIGMKRVILYVRMIHAYIAHTDARIRKSHMHMQA